MQETTMTTPARSRAVYLSDAEIITVICALQDLSAKLSDSVGQAPECPGCRRRFAAVNDLAERFGQL